MVTDPCFFPALRGNWPPEDDLAFAKVGMLTRWMLTADKQEDPESNGT